MEMMKNTAFVELNDSEMNEVNGGWVLSALALMSLAGISYLGVKLVKKVKAYMEKYNASVNEARRALGI